jgi:ribosomal protein S18 acetylase RimI-like enzyme
MGARRLPKGCSIRAMALADHGAAIGIWRKTEGLCVVAEDSRACIRTYLARNRGLCFVATSGGRVVGTVLCGHDGRRATLRHLAVAPEFRKMGLGRALVVRCLRLLARQGIRKCNLYVMDGNAEGMRFWRRLGFRLLPDEWRTLQKDTR